MTRFTEQNSLTAPTGAAHQSDTHTLAAANGGNTGTNSHLSEYAMQPAPVRTANTANPHVVSESTPVNSASTVPVGYNSTTSRSLPTTTRSSQSMQSTQNIESTSTATTSSTTRPYNYNNGNSNGNNFNVGVGASWQGNQGGQGGQDWYYRQMELRREEQAYQWQQQQLQASLYYGATTPYYGSNYSSYDNGSDYWDPNQQSAYQPVPSYQSDTGYVDPRYANGGNPGATYLDPRYANTQVDNGYAGALVPPGSYADQSQGQVQGQGQGDYVPTRPVVQTANGVVPAAYSGADSQVYRGNGRGARQVASVADDYEESSYDGPPQGAVSDQGRGHSGERFGRSDRANSGTWNQYDFAVYDHLKEQAQALVGHCIQEYDKSVPIRLGCARAVSLLVNHGYGFPVTDQSIGNLEQTLRKDGFTQVAIKDMMPGDVICGYRAPGDYPHGAVYMGNGKIFNNDSDDGIMEIQSIAKYNKSDFKRFVVLRRPADVPAVARGSSNGNAPGADV